MAWHGISGGLKRLTLVVSVFAGGWGAGLTSAMAQTGTLIDMSKKVCAAGDLPANPTPAQITSCTSYAAAIGETVSYVLNAINVSPEAQDIILTDPLPAGFVPIPGAQCLGAVFPNVPTVWGGSVGPGTLPAGQSATCIIPGYFTASGHPENTASFSATGQQSGTKAEGSDDADIEIDPDLPLPGNLKIEKSADKTVDSLANGPVTVTYTITVTNTGAGDLYTGGYLQVVDNLAALPSSGISFGYDVDAVGCTPSPGTPLCPTEINGSSSGNTTNQSNGVELGVWEYQPGEAGFIPAGGSFEITYTVTFRDPEGCLYPDTLNGLRNTAFIRFANGQGAFSDMIVGDNTSFTDLEITDLGIDEECPVRPQDELTVEKIQKSPLGGIIPWNTQVEYRIIVSNPVGIGQTGAGTGPTIQNIDVTDLLASQPGMPIVDVTTHLVDCLPGVAFCDPAYLDPQPNSQSNHILNQYLAPVPVAKARILSLADGESIEIQVILSFRPLGCVSYPSGGLHQTANYGKIDYQIQTPIKNGFVTSQHSGIAGPVITDHDKAPDCTLKVEKKGPAQILFGQPFTYNVSYENYGPDPIDIGTLLDAIAIDLPDYAVSLNGTYGYTCSMGLPNLVQSLSGPIGIGYNAPAAQGTRLLQTQAPNVPVVLPGNTTLDCKFTLTLAQPDASNPYCMSEGDPRLVNAALMDVSHYFNTNLPVPPQAYATTAASLPLCRDVAVTKVMSPKVVAPGGLATVTLTFHNNSDDPISGAMVSDILNAQMSFNSLISCTNCLPGEPVTSATSVSANFDTIPAHGTGEVIFTVTVMGPAPGIVPNVVNGTYDPAGNWYDQSDALQDDDIIGVFDLFPVQISKSIINTSPGQPPMGPFLIDVNCSYAFGGHSFAFAGQASITLPNATAPVIDPATNAPLMVPTGAACTFQETGLPAGAGGFGFSAVGYAPGVPSGTFGQLTVVAGDRNEGLVENCYGPRTANPLQGGHDVGGPCPPVVVEDKTEITKVCTPATPGPGGRPWYAQCTVTATTTGQFPQGLTVSENFNGSSGDIVLNGTSPASLQWTCDPSPTAAPGPHVCTLAGGTQSNPGPNTATFVYMVSFADANEAKDSKNCAVLADRERALAEACTGFEVDDRRWPEFKIDKVCSEPVQRKYAVGAAATGLGWFSDCEITVSANGPVSGPITVTDSLGSLPGGTAMIHSLTAAGWTCTPMPASFAPVAGPVTCTMPGGAFPASGQSVISATVLLPPGETSARNCVDLAYLGQPVGESCAGIKVPQDRGLEISKVVVNNAPGSVAGLDFTVSVSCSNSPGTAAFDTLQDGQTKPFWMYVPNTTCTVDELDIPLVDACGPDMVPVWTESYAPSNVVTLSPTGTLVTITNTLDCKPVPQGRVIIRKSLDTLAAPGANVAGLTFPVSLNCGGAVQTGTIALNAPWSVGGLSATTPCTLSEDVAALPTANICPPGQTASWGVSYIPASQTATPTVVGAAMVVVNTLKCATGVTGGVGNVDVIDNLPDPIAFPDFTLTKTCQPAMPVAGASFAQALCTITVTQTQGAPVHEIELTETLMSGVTGAQIVSLSSPQGWSFPATPFAANAPVRMQLPGAGLVGTPAQSVITAVVQFPGAEAATGAQNCVSMLGLDPEGFELAAAGPVCAALQNGAATIVPDPDGDGPALELSHELAGPCRADRERQSYTCLFTLGVTNTLEKDFVGPEVISMTYGDIRPVTATGQGEGWSCQALDQAASCVNGEVALTSGGATEVTMTFLLPAQESGGRFTICARLGVPDGGRARVLLAQQAAQAFGLNVGKADGEMGPRTRAAISEMQERLGLEVTGEPDNALFVALGLRLDKGIAPLCVTADLPPLDNPECRKGEEFVEGEGCRPIPRPTPAPAEEPAKKTPDPVRKPLQCDPETTVLRNGECKCRKEGTVKLTETTCG